MEGFTAMLIGLPPELKAAIAVLVMLLVRAALAGRVPEQSVTEISAVITTAVVGFLEILLGFIPLEFEAVAQAVLQLIVVLVGTIFVVRAYLTVKFSAAVRGVRF